MLSSKFSRKDWTIGPLIRRFVFLDLLFWGGWGLIGPIFAVFVLGRIENATLITVGLATGCYWAVKAITQVIVAGYIDDKKGERDDMRALTAGLFLGSIAAFSFLFISDYWGLFGATILQGLAFGFYAPAWSATFSRHLDTDHYALDWSLDSTTVALSSAITAVAGGALAQFLGFNSIFAIAGVLSFFSGLVVMRVPKNLISANDPKPTTPQ